PCLVQTQSLYVVMKLRPANTLPDLGAITTRRALRADGSERVYQYKTFRVPGRDGSPTTVDVAVDELYVWLRTYPITTAGVGRLLRDAAHLLRRSPPTSSGRYLSWSVLVRNRAHRLMQALAAGATHEDALFAEQNNAVWDAALGDN